MNPLEFLARLVPHIPGPGPVMPRYCGWYASRTRGARRRQATDPTAAPVTITDPEDWSLRAARFSWAERLGRSLLKRRGGHGPAEPARLQLAEPVDLVATKSVWLAALEEAEEFVMPLPETDCSSQRLLLGFGSPGGVLPQVGDVP